MMTKNAGCIITELLKMPHLLGKNTVVYLLLTKKIETKVMSRVFLWYNNTQNNIN